MRICVSKVYKEQVGLFDTDELDGMQVTLYVVDGFLIGTTDKGQLLVLTAPEIKEEPLKKDGE